MCKNYRKSRERAFWAERIKAKALGLRIYLAYSVISKKASVSGREYIKGRLVGKKVRKISRN